MIYIWISKLSQILFSCNMWKSDNCDIGKWHMGVHMVHQGIYRSNIISWNIHLQSNYIWIVCCACLTFHKKLLKHCPYRFWKDISFLLNISQVSLIQIWICFLTGQRKYSPGLLSNLNCSNLNSNLTYRGSPTYINNFKYCSFSIICSIG